MFYPRRKPIRLAPGDYAGPGSWFVTIKAVYGERLFGAVMNGEVFLDDIGLIAQRNWRAIPLHFPHVAIDSFVIMPNHVHGILVFHGHDPRLRAPADFEQAFGRSVRGSLGTVIGAYKASVTRDTRKLLHLSVDLWQPRFIDTRIRSEEMLQRFRNYICNNPSKWQDQAPEPADPPGRSHVLPPPMPLRTKA